MSGLLERRTGGFRGRPSLTARYGRIHKWLRSQYGSADHCDNPHCPRTNKRFQWALKKGKKYDFAVANFMQLCAACHAKHDKLFTLARATKGGQTVAQRYGSSYMSKIGKRGRKKQLKKS